MHGLTSGMGAMHGFLRTAMVLATCILLAALLLTPIALQQPGSGSPIGLAIAAAICLVSGLVAEIFVALLSRQTPLGATLVGMMVRMMLPLGVCVAIVASGQNGRQHLAFIGYLLTFYVVTLALETCLAVKRASARSTSLTQTPR
jgi:hypothetical protein